MSSDRPRLRGYLKTDCVLKNGIIKADLQECARTLIYTQFVPSLTLFEVAVG